MVFFKISLYVFLLDNKGFDFCMLFFNNFGSKIVVNIKFIRIIFDDINKIVFFIGNIFLLVK